MTLTPDRRRDEPKARRRRSASGPRAARRREKDAEHFATASSEASGIDPIDPPEPSPLPSDPPDDVSDSLEPAGDLAPAGEEEQSSPEAALASSSPADEEHLAEADVTDPVAPSSSSAESSHADDDWFFPVEDTAPTADTADEDTRGDDRPFWQDPEWIADVMQSSEHLAHKQNDKIEAQREVLGDLGPGPADGEVGRGFAAHIPAESVHDRMYDPKPERVWDTSWGDEDETARSDEAITSANDPASDSEAPVPFDADPAPFGPADTGGSADTGSPDDVGSWVDRSSRVDMGSPADTGRPANMDSHTDTDHHLDDSSMGSGEPEAGEAAAATIHPLLNEQAWSDLGQMAPEMTGSIEHLRALVDELECFERPMGPDEAVTMLDGIETLNRLLESLSVVTLSVFERVGTPRDYGAKTTRELARNRLGLSAREASRRVDLAEHLGRRVNPSGEALEPVNPTIAEGLRTGMLSSAQASVITGCLDDLPRTVTEDQRLTAERILVEHAPAIHVRDIRVLFNEILKWLDPDGEQPDESVPREDFCVNLRARKDGTWDLKGRLDAVTGGIMHGLLTSRLHTDEPAAEGETSDQEAAAQGEASGEEALAEGGSTPDATSGETVSEAAPAPTIPVNPAEAGAGPDAHVVDLEAEALEIFNDVLSGDRSNAIDPTPELAAAAHTHSQHSGPTVPAGCGVREDGTPVPMADEQPSVRNRIYERFATLIGRIEMGRVGAGSPFALVVTAKAEDIAAGQGRADTGADEPFPIGTATREGLNGAVFFHLMGEKGRTVSVRTENRCANRNQLTLLAARDKGCTFPGCETPPGWCDAHHVVPWSEGGKTELNNLTLACGAHHHLIDRTDWHTVMLYDGRPAWVPPASIDPARRPVLHSRFIARDIADTLFD